MERRGFFRLSLLANHFPELHGVRVLAIVLVVQVHVTLLLAEAKIPLPPAFVALSTSIFFGMDLFFLLSGFLIGTMILHSLGESSRQHVVRFYARRSFRIFPLYYVTLTALALLLPLNAIQKHNLPFEYAYLTNYLYLVPSSVVMLWGWSLCVEEHFYLAVPLLMTALHALSSHRARLTLLAALWLSALVIRLAIFFSHRGPWDDAALTQALYVRTHTRFDTLVCGIVLAYLQRHFATELRALLAKAWARRAFWAISLVSLWLLLLPREAHGYLFFRTFAWGTVTSTLYLPLLLLLLNAPGRLSRWLARPLFLRVATLGYGIYLFHIPLCTAFIVPFALALHRAGWALSLVWPLSLALLLVLSAALSYVTHVLVEKPALWLRDRVAK